MLLLLISTSTQYILTCSKLYTYLLKINNRKTTKRCEMLSGLITKRHQINTTDVALVPIVDFEQVNACWEKQLVHCRKLHFHYLHLTCRSTTLTFNNVECLKIKKI